MLTTQPDCGLNACIAPSAHVGSGECNTYQVCKGQEELQGAKDDEYAIGITAYGRRGRTNWRHGYCCTVEGGVMKLR